MATDNPISGVTLATEHVDGWDWENSHVNQSYADGEGNVPNFNIHDIVESGTVLIAAGPADLSAAVDNTDAGSGVRIVPIGLVESASIGMNKPLSRIFEIGSKLSYIIPGRTVGEIGLSRVFFDGPSLLKVLYQGEIKSDKFDSSTLSKKATFMSNPTSKLADAKPMQPIGSGHVAMNLASSFFEQPVGLAFYFQDQEHDSVGTIYFEGCRVSSYNMGISANMNVLTETVRMEFTQCVPVVSDVSAENGAETTANYGDLGTTNKLWDVPIIGSGETT